jgi:anti-sigma regulatory factor (Ser/Thr protein kinase)
VEVPADLPPLPILDEHLQMVVEKLLQNAIKFAKPDGGQVLVRVAMEDGTVRFEVCDQGVGIPEEEQDKIFDRFYQLTRAGLERQGAGLGLAVARGLVELYGGQISVASRVDVGSTFTFTVPKARQVSVAAPPPPPAAVQPSVEGAALTAEEAFRRLGITFEGEKKPQEPPPAEEPAPPPPQAKGRRRLFWWRKRS